MPSAPAAEPPRPAGETLHALVAGTVAALVAFGGAFAVVLAGLSGVGATDEQAASGLLVLSVLMGALTVWLCVRTRTPITIAWSTPGAALLVSAGPLEGGWPAAIGGFVVCGALIALTGVWRPLERLIAAIPGPIANAMLAGVLLTVCLAPVRTAADAPATTLPVILVWVALLRVARRWAVPGALVAVALVTAIDPAGGGAVPSALPVVSLTAPVLDLGAVVGVAIPLFIVTMASQNVAGLTVLASFGFRPRLRPILAGTGLLTVAGAPFGAHALNLAAISAALTAGPDAHADAARRWIAGVAAGVGYVVLGLAAGAVTALAAAAPPGLIEAVAGLALLGALGAALRAAAVDDEQREAATVTFVIAASGITALGISAPFWALVAGLGLLGLQRLRRGADR